MIYLLITREIDYALRILSALSTGKQLTTYNICQQELVPQQFGYKILKKLAKNGLVKITCGGEGGCQICCDLKFVTFYDLVKIMEKDKWISACMQQDFLCTRRQKNKNYCSIHKNLSTIQSSLDKEFKSYSLYEIINGESVN